CMQMAIESVKAPIDYINPHATSTPVGDIPEINAIREVFGDKMPPISATKSLTGHSQGAAGVHEAIYTLLMMQSDFICESANIEEIDPAVADANIVRKRIDGVKINTALSNSFGAGGARRRTRLHLARRRPSQAAEAARRIHRQQDRAARRCRKGCRPGRGVR